MEKTLFSLTVAETDQDREFWASRPWVGSGSDSVRRASIIVAPWVNFRDNAEVLFPQGTTDFVKAIQQEFSVAVAVDSAAYAEIALYSNIRRLPVIFVTAVMLPALTGALGNIISDQIDGSQPSDTIEMKLIVESPSGPCISVEYKGPPDRALNRVVDEIERCLPDTSKTDRYEKPSDVPKTK